MLEFEKRAGRVAGSGPIAGIVGFDLLARDGEAQRLLRISVGVIPTRGTVEAVHGINRTAIDPVESRLANCLGQIVAGRQMAVAMKAAYLAIA